MALQGVPIVNFRSGIDNTYIHHLFYNAGLISSSLLLADADLQLKVLTKIIVKVNPSILVES